MGHEPEQSNADAAPIPLNYAGSRKDGKPSEPSLPGPALKAGRRLAALSAITLLGTLLASDALFLWSAFAGFLLAAMALVAGMVALHRNTDRGLSDSQRIEKRRLGSTIALLVLLLAVQGWATSVTLSRIRAVGKSSVTAANLRGIGMAIVMYHEDSESYPVSLDALVSANLTSPMQYWSPNDPNIRPRYSSFAYFPGERPQQSEGDVLS